MMLEAVAAAAIAAFLLFSSFLCLFFSASSRACYLAISISCSIYCYFFFSSLLYSLAAASFSATFCFMAASTRAFAYAAFYDIARLSSSCLFDGGGLFVKLYFFSKLRTHG